MEPAAWADWDLRISRCENGFVVSGPWQPSHRGVTKVWVANDADHLVAIIRERLAEMQGT